MKPTRQLPREKGVPYTLHDIILEQVRRDEARRPSLVTHELPPPAPKTPFIKKTALGANWAKANIFRFSLSLIQP